MVKQQSVTLYTYKTFIVEIVSGHSSSYAFSIYWLSFVFKLTQIRFKLTNAQINVDEW